MKPGPLFGSGACRSFLQAVCDPVLVTDDEGRIVFCNEAAAELTGHHVNQLVGAMIGTAVDGWKLHWDKNVCSRNVEAVVQRRDGADIPVEMSFAIWDEDGRRMIGAIIRSTIARRSAEAMQAAAQATAERAEREAQAAHERLREAVEMLPEAVVMLDAEDHFILWNHKYAALFPEIAHVLKPGAFYPDILQV